MTNQPTPEGIAREITNPIIGRFPDFDDATRPAVIDAIKLGIETDRGFRAPADPDTEREVKRIQDLNVATLNVYAPTIIAKLREERS